MHGASVFQIAAHGDFQMVQAALRFVNGDQIQQRLAGVLVGAVARVNHGHARKFGQHARCAVFRVALDNRIGIAGDNSRGIGQRFAFFRAGVRAVGKTDDLTAQPLHGGFERQARAGGRFEEAGRNQPPFQQIAARLPFQAQRGVQQALQLLDAQIGNG